jgi:hypothetical protein
VTNSLFPSTTGPKDPPATARPVTAHSCITATPPDLATAHTLYAHKPNPNG